MNIHANVPENIGQSFADTKVSAGRFAAPNLLTTPARKQKQSPRYSSPPTYSRKRWYAEQTVTRLFCLTGVRPLAERTGKVTSNQSGARRHNALSARTFLKPFPLSPRWLVHPNDPSRHGTTVTV